MYEKIKKFFLHVEGGLDDAFDFVEKYLDFLTKF